LRHVEYLSYGLVECVNIFINMVQNIDLAFVL